jgi:glycosyltransferase involved in cell wall biosynthesis
MRILHVDPETGWGGGQVQVLGLLRELKLGGHDVRLAAHPRGRLAAAASSLGVQVFPLPIRNHADIVAGLALRRLARGHDLVHFHTARAHALAPFVSAMPRVVTRRMDYVPRGGWYTRWLYNRAVDRVIAISGAVRSALLTAGVDPARVRVVPSGVDPTHWRAPAADVERVRAEWHVPRTGTVVLHVGVLEARKGHAVLLDAIERLRGAVAGATYVFCGEGSARAALERAVADRGLPVRFAGFRPDVAACLGAADLVVLPSLQEGLGVAALEAMAAERAVVGSRVGGLAEVIEPERTGLLVPPGDAAALATAVAALVADPARRAAMGRAGAARVAERFSLAAMAAGTLACYEELA